ncbi:hypothetical protein LXL04_010708 [Taraxacum kok-saghyz]
MSAGGKRLTSAESKSAFVFWKTKEVCRGKNVCGREDMVQAVPCFSLPFHPLFSPDRTKLNHPPDRYRRRCSSTAASFRSTSPPFSSIYQLRFHSEEKSNCVL